MSRLPIVLRRRRRFRMITIMCAMAMARMETDESLSFEHSRGRGKNKCFWTDEESKALIDSLQELSCDPMWKSDGGFRNGSQNSELSKKRKKLAAVRGNDAKKMKGSTSVAHDAEVEGLRKEVSAAFQGMSTHFATIASAIADENN
nr:Myb/SANT-like domain-containing protein [Ipomoea batatas]